MRAIHSFRSRARRPTAAPAAEVKRRANHLTAQPIVTRAIVEDFHEH